MLHKLFLSEKQKKLYIERNCKKEGEKEKEREVDKENERKRK
jgi:hypothetical protein